MREQEQAAAASDADLRKKRNATAALDARIADATATLARLKDEVKAKREEVVASVLDGRPLETFYVRVLACAASWALFAALHDSRRCYTRR
jgi:septal ring factor EnvC (AmiA/AmiB activator)